MDDDGDEETCRYTPHSSPCKPVRLGVETSRATAVEQLAHIVREQLSPLTSPQQQHGRSYRNCCTSHGQGAGEECCIWCDDVGECVDDCRVEVTTNPTGIVLAMMVIAAIVYISFSIDFTAGGQGG